MNLFIDDVRTPKEHINEWSIARTNTQAIETILNFPEKFQEIHIDHDIAGVAPLADTSPETFMPVVYFLSMIDPKEVCDLIILHTWNNSAAYKMAMILRDAKYIVRIVPY